jgi:HPt (histidine-containing phosphotransfer) domain-containing protein
MNDYLTKPFKNQDLMPIVDRYLPMPEGGPVGDRGEDGEAGAYTGTGAAGAAAGAGGNGGERRRQPARTPFKATQSTTPPPPHAEGPAPAPAGTAGGDVSAQTSSGLDAVSAPEDSNEDEPAELEPVDNDEAPPEEFDTEEAAELLPEDSEAPEGVGPGGGAGAADPRAAETAGPEGDGGDMQDVFDYEQAVQAFMGKKDVVQRVVNRFVEHTEKQLGQLRSLLEEEDLGQAQTIAHGIKGGAWNLAAQRLGDAAYAVELATKENRRDEAVRDLERLNQQFGVFKQVCDEHPEL